MDVVRATPPPGHGVGTRLAVVVKRVPLRRRNNLIDDQIAPGKGDALIGGLCHDTHGERERDVLTFDLAGQADLIDLDRVLVICRRDR